MIISHQFLNEWFNLRIVMKTIVPLNTTAVIGAATKCSLICDILIKTLVRPQIKNHLVIRILVFKIM